ncbi:MAG: invertase recombinase-like protein [Deltaproteobacteria bacterium]|nr:MAG: invertase recombinase-like protein [Deltaproteobacteria bacterium]
MRASAFFLCVAIGLGGCGDDGGTGGADTALTDITFPTDTVAADTTTVADSVTIADSVAPGDTATAEDTLATDVIADTAVAQDTAVGEDTTVVEDTTVAQDTTVADTTVADTTVADTTVAEDTTVADTTVAQDTTVPADTTIPPADNVIAEGSFESWADGLPVGWYGDASNLSTDGVVEDTSAAHDGVRACQLVNEGTTHKRFTTAPFALPAGHYSCVYWVRGTGEIRNARYTGDYSSYSAYDAIDSDDWTPISYAFNAVDDVPAFELIFSVRSTGAARGHLHIDDVRCAREAEACDTVSCLDWQRCDEATASCVTASGFCGGDGECASWEVCGADHLCALAEGACYGTVDCDGATPVCDLATHTCVAGDPCANVSCEEWETCRPSDATCQVTPGRCEALSDCEGALPVCDVAAHDCVAVEAAANIVPNGGFEAWSEYTFGGATTYLLPDAWYGECDGCSPYWPTTEISPSNVRQYTTAVHGGSYACQLVDPTVPAERFVTEPFTVTPGKSYACSYRVRGHGTYRQRAYCGGWGPDTDFTAIDSDEWQTTSFTMSGAVSWCVLIFYASNTDADRDHIQLDDVVCIDPAP